MFPKFLRYLDFNLIDENIYQLACNSLLYNFSKENEEIFENIDSYKNFCIITRGKIKVKYVDNTYGKLNKIKYALNQEKFIPKYIEKIFHKGQFFSKKIKSTDGSQIFSAIAIEDSEIIYLEYRNYENLFEKYILKSEKERKKFIYKTLKNIVELGPAKFDIFYNLMDLNVKSHI